ncbi:MAG: phosphate acyltransferase PlsX [Candidatus Marinimicrobia bacterium]|nr:phosphate acyltransferase PlsX [Candidatus Neomarinimicrobiota bacterium]
MRILLDAMGGDYAPRVTVDGAFNAIKERPGLEVVLYGDRDLILDEFKRHKTDKVPGIVHCSQSIDMHDAPLVAVRSKKDSSIVRGINDLKNGIGDAFVSAGNTGALMSASLLILGRMASVHRPALAAYIPTEKGGCILCDVGANPSPKPLDLLQNGFMAAYYAEILLKKKNPTVGLLNIGEEAFKGSHFDRSTFELLEKMMPNFIGNVEGNGILRGKADVVITDGFTGNILIKFGESIFEFFFSQLKQHVNDSLLSKIGGLFMKGSFRKIKEDLNYEAIGGAPLLGVKGISIKAHGHSSARAICNAVLSAEKYVSQKLVEKTNDRLKMLNKELKIFS